MEETERVDNSFPLLELPHLARQLVLKHFESIDLFDISLTSKRMVPWIREIDRKAKIHSIKINSSQCKIKTRFVGSEKTAKFVFFEESDPIQGYTETRKVGHLSIDNSLKFNNCETENPEIRCTFSPRIEAFIQVTKQWMEIFPGPIHVEVFPQHYNNLSSLFKEDHMRKLDSLSILGAFAMKSYLEQVCEYVEVKKQLCIEADTDEDYVVQQCLDVEDLTLVSAGWMSQDFLCRLTCRLGYIYNHYFTNKDIVAFGKSWKANKFSRLERFRFSWRNRDPLDLEGLDAKPWDSGRREKNYVSVINNRLERMDCSEGFDIEKEDGTLATIMFSPNSNCIVFLVWRERFPERKRMEKLPETLDPFYFQLERINRTYRDECSLERMLCNRDLKPKEFVETFKILRGMDADGQERSTGKIGRRRIFEKMLNYIDYQESTG